MKRTLSSLMFLAVFGMALAGPPVDVPLVCGASEDAPVVGVASLVEDQLHLALIAGALEACTDGVYGVMDGATILTVSYAIEDGAVADVQVAIAADPEATPSLSYAEVPAVAVEGMLAAVRNREAAFGQAERVREPARAQAGGPVGDPPMDAPGDRDQVRDQLRDQDCDPVCDPVCDQDRDAGEDACDGEAFGAPPVERPASGTPRRP